MKSQIKDEINTDPPKERMKNMHCQMHRLYSLGPNLHTYIYIYSAWNYYEINGNNDHLRRQTQTSSNIISLVGNKLARLLSMVRLPV
jgi:hypothetical protein